jgi:type IV fimbrial biogenesis protein FimT
MRLGNAMVARGFTLIELMIGIAIFALLTVLAAPMYGDFMGNTQVRTAAESVLTGVRFAQSEAVRHGIPVRFELVSGTNWQVVFLADDQVLRNCGATTNCISDPQAPAAGCAPASQCVLRSYDFVQNGGAPYAFATPVNGNTVVTFSSLGIALPLNQDASTPLSRVDVTNLNYTTARPLSVIVGGLTSAANGGTKLCDPSLPPTDVMGCPTS